jgi:hypothetical protein
MLLTILVDDSYDINTVFDKLGQFFNLIYLNFLQKLMEAQVLNIN